MGRSIFKFLASLQLALLLLAVIIIATAKGTILESTFNAEVAKQYIYNAWWFNAWLVMLCVNLFCVAAIRYPWKPHQTGFVITHAGIITLLVGGMIDREWGIEGFIRLTRGNPPTDIMELHDQELLVYAPGNPMPASTTMNMKVYLSAAGASSKQLAVNSPSPDVKVEVAQIKLVEPYREVFIDPLAGKLALQITLRGPMMGVHDQWLLLDEHLQAGPATLHFHRGRPENFKHEGDGEKLVPRLERHFVFAKQGQVISRAVSGQKTGAEGKLVLDEKQENPVLQLKLLDKEFKIAVGENIKKSLPLEGLDGWRLYIINYFPNFRMMADGQPGTLDDKPENPALVFELNGPPGPPGEDDADDPHAGATAKAKPNALEFYLGEDGKLRYVLKSRTKGESSGDVEFGKPVPVGWAPGAEFIANKLEEKAGTKLAWRPMADGAGKNMGEPGNPGMQLKISAGGESKEVWIGQRPLDQAVRQKEPGGPSTIEIERDAFEVGGKKIELAFYNKWVRLPFKVALLKFNAPYDEGENSTTFMSFESTLSFNGEEDSVTLRGGAKALGELGVSDPGAGGTITVNGAIIEENETSLTLELPSRRSAVIPKADVANAEKRSHKIHMNVPTIYPKTALAPFFGTSHKFSQADHKMPQNPDYSGVQVLRDPGWFFKWVGSLMICFGIFTMFYLKPYFHGRRMAAPVKADAKAGSHKAGKRSEVSVARAK